MSSPLASLIASGTKLWLDSVDPELIASNLQWGASGATSNPIIICDLIKGGRFDSALAEILRRPGVSDEEAAWLLTDQVVAAAQRAFLPIWEATHGNDGYVSFELDPLLEDSSCRLTVDERSARYVELGVQWSRDNPNRMIKIPATRGGIGALERLCAAGVSLNVTLIFTLDQYRAARDAVWKGAQQRSSLSAFKSVYSIFVSRVDVYTEKHVPELSPASQGQVGIVNVQQIWQANREFWRSHPTPLDQEIVFASTGVKKASDPPWKYVAALAGSDIQTNPPATNDAVARSGLEFSRQIDQLPPSAVQQEIASLVNVAKMEAQLMEEGLEKFAQPQKDLLALIARARQRLA